MMFGGLRQRLPKALRRPARYLRDATLGSSTDRWLSVVQRKGFDFRSARALELFGKDGLYVTRYYAQRVRRLEIWEIDGQHERALRQRFPTATVKIVDSIQEIRRATGEYEFIVADCWPGPYGDYFENFDLFPDLFRIAAPSAVVMLNVVGHLDEKARVERDLFTPAHLAKRRSFYGVDHPENVPFERMLATYTRLAEESGYQVNWSFFWPNLPFHRLLLGIERVPQEP